MITETQHRIHNRDARDPWPCEPESVHLVITSPPYPMIAMWDENFARFRSDWNGEVPPAREADFESMHQELDRVWARSWDALCEGGFLVINIGDATRTIEKRFRLFSNHTRIIQGCLTLGFGALPGILWRKPTNAPNKFMGSGMLPGGAYVTLEHEHILIFRKGNKRLYETVDVKFRRRRSALFWEERNIWFSDIWQDIRGERQAFGANGSRSRSGAFPFEFAYRLVNMFSLQGDTICDPFLGTGTTSLVAMASARHSLGLEIDPGLQPLIASRVAGTESELNQFTQRRYEKHLGFVQERSENGKQKDCAHYNEQLDIPVVTSQETDLKLPWIENLQLIAAPRDYDHSSDSAVGDDTNVIPDPKQNIWQARYRDFESAGKSVLSREVG